MADPNWANQTMWTGDNLPIMRGMNSESIDLIYLDPPFNSKANYAAPVGSKAAGAEFKDTWTLRDIDAAWLDLIEQKHPRVNRVIHAAMTDSDKSYLIYMAARLIEMRRILKPNGSIYLHCDPTMSHYLKLLMDAIYGRRNMRNEIVWCYAGGGRPKNDFANKHDIILRYAKGKEVTFVADAVRIPYRAEGQGRKDESMWGRHKGTDRVYKPNPLGKIPEDWWFMHQLNANAPERTGYPTQKPLALLDRIIMASTNESDVVLDPFCGCATACVAAHDRNRQWTGIDVSSKAFDLVKQRITERGGLFYDLKHREDVPQRTDLGEIPKYNSPANKNKLYGEQGGDCAGCGEHFLPQNLTVDHIIARTAGGTYHIGNLQLLCGNCNSIKGNRGMEYLMTRLQDA